MLSLRAPSWAKINLTLHVCGRRPDGFHELESLVAYIGLADGVTATLLAGDHLSMTCSDPAIPSDGTNLVMRAAALLRETCGGTWGAHINVEKRIPAGAGLGGGSSNAAATLGLLNELWSLGLSDHQLVELGGRLGSDVPVFCRNWPLTIMRGRGEIVSPVNRRVGGVLLLISPQIHSSTVAVYRAFAAAGRRSERPSAATLMGLDDDAASSGQTSPANDRERPSITINGAKLMRSLFNDLEEAAFEVNPELRKFAEHLRTVSGLPFCMSGSGSAFFCIIDRDTDEQFAYVEGLRDCFPTARVIRTHFVH